MHRPLYSPAALHTALASTASHRVAPPDNPSAQDDDEPTATSIQLLRLLCISICMRAAARERPRRSRREGWRSPGSAGRARGPRPALFGSGTHTHVTHCPMVRQVTAKFGRNGPNSPTKFSRRPRILNPTLHMIARARAPHAISKSEERT